MKEKWKIVSVVIIGLCGAFLYWITWSGSAKEIESVAGQFRPAAGWKQANDQVVPPRTVCLGLECPSVHRSWTTDNNPSKEEFQSVLAQAGWKFDIQDDCLVDSSATSGLLPICSAEGSASDYRISVTVWGNSEVDTEGKVTLTVTK